MAHDKHSLRLKMQEVPLAPLHAGKVAEILRKQDVYRHSKILFVSPVPQLQQIRINALIDGKMLLMPGPAIKNGFYLLKPYVIAFKDLGHAVTLKGIESFGKLQTAKALGKLHIDLALTDCLALSANGCRLGSGTGFFDLAMGILADLGAVDSKTNFGAVGLVEQVVDEVFPQESWDVLLHYFLTSEGLRVLRQDEQKLQVVWDALEKKRIRKIEPLWQLYQANFPSVATGRD